MKNIGNKIEFSTEGKRISVEIFGRSTRWKESLLFGWAVAWTICGLYILAFLFGPISTEERFFLMAYLAFWAYFEYKVVYAWLWRKFGKEVLYTSDGNLFIKNDLFGKGEEKKYFLENIQNLGIINHDKSSFSWAFGNSFWVVGGEMIGFDYMGQKIVIAKQIEDADAEQLSKLLKKYFKKK